MCSVIELYPWVVTQGRRGHQGLQGGERQNLSPWEEHSASEGLGKEKLGQKKSYHGSAWSMEGPARWGKTNAPMTTLMKLVAVAHVDCILQDPGVAGHWGPGRAQAEVVAAYGPL